MSLVGELDSKVWKLKAENKELKSQLDALRWMSTEDPPEINKDDWTKKVWVLEYESKEPIIMTMAEVWLDEHSEAEYWMPIPALKEKE